METGIKGREEVTVTPELTAESIGSGTVPVFATPMMISLVEKACRCSVEPYLDEGQTTVGTLVNVAHLAATPVGMRVWCETELIEIDRRRLVFRVTVRDDAGPVGEGTHERFIIDSDRFVKKAEARGCILPGMEVREG